MIAEGSSPPNHDCRGLCAQPEKLICTGLACQGFVDAVLESRGLMKCMLLSACCLLNEPKNNIMAGVADHVKAYLRLFISSLVKILQHAWQSQLNSSTS